LFFRDHDEENVTRELEHHKRGLWTEEKKKNQSISFPFFSANLDPSVCIWRSCRV